MARIANTYGKTWHSDRDKKLPLGIPALMMGFTGDDQLDPNLLADRDRRFNVNTKSIKKSRDDIQSGPVDTHADAWENGKALQLKITCAGSYQGNKNGPTSGCEQPPENKHNQHW